MDKKTNIDFSSDIKSILHTERVAAFDVGGKIILNVFRDNFDSFEELIDFYSANRKYAQSVGKTAVGEIGKILFAGGITRSDGQAISSAQISRYMSIVRKERSKKAVAVIPLPSNKALRALHNAVGGDLTRLASVTPPLHQVAISKPDNGFIEPAPISVTIPETLKRLRLEEKAGFVSDWNGYDVFTLRTLLYREYEKVKSQHLKPSFFNVVNDFNFRFSTDGLSEILQLLTAKMNKKNIYTFYADI